MPPRIFGANAFARVIRAGDSGRFNIDLKNDRKAILERASETVSDGLVDLAAFETTRIKDKPCIIYSDFHSHLVLRIISRHLQRRLRVAIPSRDQIVRGVIESLMDATPMYIMRRDISSFYESIPVAPLREALLYDTASSVRVREYLRSYFDTHCSMSEFGLPRGIGLSALLAEVSMIEFDRKVREIPGIYKYYRFSDDIIAFSYKSVDEVAPQIADCLPDSMNFNTEKLQDVALLDTTRANSTTKDVEYLGYRFAVSSYSGHADSRAVHVQISKRKLNKLRSRVILTLQNFIATPNYALLRDRIAFITSNYSVRRHGLAKTGGKTHVKSGIYYNYKQCGVYEFKNRRMVRTESTKEDLQALDKFLVGMLIGKHSGFSAILAANLSDAQMKELRKFSFYMGFSKRMNVRFRPDRIGQIKKVWSRV